MSAGQGAPTRIGKYEVLSRLGVGGMAELHVARAQAAHGFEKIVALKRILPHLVEDEDFARMFLAEARLAALLHHPNIAQVYDFGEADGTYFFTMEYVLGQDLRRVIRALRARDAWLTLDHIIYIVAQTAAGLHYAHEKEDSEGRPLKIVHRDVSPSNILVSYDGGVKLVDFGIARATLRSETTTTGVLKGKVPYMSPEQCRGEPLDRRSDVFALGVVLWELACCRRLFVGDNDLQLAQRIAGEDAPPPTAFLPHFPADLERIIMRALARDRERRYASAQELQEELEELARERKLALSSVSLGRLMSDLFADTIRAQKAALIDAKAGRRTRFPEASAATSSEEATPATASAEAVGVPSRSLSLTAADPSPRPVRRRWLAPLGLLVLAGGAAAAWWLHSIGVWGAGATASAAAGAGLASPAEPVSEAPAPAPAPASAPASASPPGPEDEASPSVPAEAPNEPEPPGATTARSKRARANKRAAKGTSPASTRATSKASERRTAGDVPADLKDPFSDE